MPSFPQGAVTFERGQLLVPLMRLFVRFLLEVLNDTRVEELKPLATKVEAVTGAVRYRFSNSWNPGTTAIEYFRALDALVVRFGQITGYDIFTNYAESHGSFEFVVRVHLPHENTVALIAWAPIHAFSRPVRARVSLAWNLPTRTKLSLPANAIRVQRREERRLGRANAA